MAGYGGQEIALNAMTPSELQQQAAQADLSQTQSQLARQSMPAELAYRQAQATGLQQQNQANALTLEQQTAEWGLRKTMADQMAQRRSTLAAAQRAPSTAASQLDTGSGSSSLDTGDGPAAPAQPTAPMFSPGVDQVMHSIDPNDPNAGQKWDEQMGALAESDPAAKQFIGKYSSSNLNGWLTQAGAHAVAQAAQTAKSPLSGMAPISDNATFDQAFGGNGAAQSPLAATGNPPAPARTSVMSPITGQHDDALSEYADLFPDKAAGYVKQQGLLQYTRTGDIAYLKRYDPEEYVKLVQAQKELGDAQKTMIQTKATTLGQSAAAFLGVARQFGVNSPQARGAWTRSITEAVNDGFMTPQAGQQYLSKAPDIGFATESMIKAQTVAEFMKTSGIEKANEQRAIVNNPEPQLSANQVDANGNLIITNAHPAPGQPALTVSGVQAGAKPSGGMMTMQAKQQMLIGAGVDPKEAALMAAGQKPMDPQRVQIAARNAALREQQNAALTGGTVNVDALTAQFAQEIQSAMPPTPTASGGGAPAPANGYTSAQQSAAHSFTKGGALPGMSVRFDGKAKLGTPPNPYFPKSQAQYNGIPKGSIYVGQDGLPHSKP